jgi:hypothetical protein
MFKVKFQKSKLGALPAFAISLPDSKVVLESINARQDSTMADYIVTSILRGINDSKGLAGIKLFDHSGDVWSCEKFQAILAEGMAASASQTFTETEFAHEWATGLQDIVASVVQPEMLEKAKNTIAIAVRHGGAAQMKRVQHEAILARFADCADEHEVIAIAVDKARKYIAEDDKIKAELESAMF